MKTYCTLPFAAYLLGLTAFATESTGHYTSKVNKMDGDEAATIKQRVNETRLAAGNAAQAAAAANQALATCSGDDSFTLSGYQDGAYDGCYSEVIVSDVTWFSLDGDFEDDHYFYQMDSGYGYLTWAFGTAVYDQDTDTVYLDYGACWDSEYGYASATHPAEVDFWICSTSSSKFDSTFDIDCGCNSAPSSSPPGAALATAFLALLGVNLLLVW